MTSTHRNQAANATHAECGRSLSAQLTQADASPATRSMVASTKWALERFAEHSAKPADQQASAILSQCLWNKAAIGTLNGSHLPS
jgi:hypothetical protein